MEGLLRSTLSREFWKYVPETPENECWIWRGTIDRDRGDHGGGYGRMYDAMNVTSKMAHRVSYELHVGPIPDKHEVIQICENRKCVNPHHLIAVTTAERTKRTYDNGRCALAKMPPMRGSTNPSSKLTEDKVREIRRLYADGGQTHRSLGEQFGVDHSIIGDILRREIWAHLD